MVSVRENRIHDAAVQLAAERQAAEVELVASIICEPLRTMPVARQCAVTPALFTEDDLRIIFCGAAVGAEHAKPKDVIRWLLTNGLKQAGHWDERAPIAPPFGSRWCDENLSLLRGMYFFSPSSIKRNAERLKALARRQKEAAQHLRHAVALLDGREGE